MRCLETVGRAAAAGAFAVAILLPLAFLSPVTAQNDHPGYVAVGDAASSTDQQAVGPTANSLTPAQAQAQALGTAGFQTGAPALPCAGTVGQSCAAAGAVSGTLTRTGSLTVPLTATVADEHDGAAVDSAVQFTTQGVDN